jgi:hypothetical protein
MFEGNSRMENVEASTYSSSNTGKSNGKKASRPEPTPILEEAPAAEA